MAVQTNNMKAWTALVKQQQPLMSQLYELTGDDSGVKRSGQKVYPPKITVEDAQKAWDKELANSTGKKFVEFDAPFLLRRMKVSQKMVRFTEGLWGKLRYGKHAVKGRVSDKIIQRLPTLLSRPFAAWTEENGVNIIVALPVVGENGQPIVAAFNTNGQMTSIYEYDEVGVGQRSGVEQLIYKIRKAISAKEKVYFRNNEVGNALVVGDAVETHRLITVLMATASTEAQSPVAPKFSGNNIITQAKLNKWAMERAGIENPYSAMEAGDGKLSPERMRHLERFVGRMVGNYAKVHFEDDFHSAGEFRPGNPGVIILSTALVDQEGTAAHESMHAFFNMLIEGEATETQKVLLDAANSPMLKRRLETLAREGAYSVFRK